MQRRPLFLCAAAAALGLCVSGFALAQATLLQRADGTQISAQVDLPAGHAKVPALVLAPGQAYHMSLPAMEATARALSERGVAVFRFNWAYFTAEPKGQASPDLALELQDLQAVLAAARAHPRVDPQHITVGGKSLGSVVAWRAFVADPKLRSALLLTPICSRIPKGEASPKPEGPENYPGLALEARPSLWIAGDADPLCAPLSLYAFAAGGPKAMRVAIVGGDHSFENRSLSTAEAEAFRTGQLRAVSALAAGFVDPVSRPRP